MPKETGKLQERLKPGAMIIYDSKIARLLQGRLNPYDYVTLPIIALTTLPCGEKGIWEEMGMCIHRCQYTKCFLASLLSSLLLGWQACWGLAVLPPFIYYIPYWVEQSAAGHSAFGYEAERESEKVSYFAVRKRFAWRKWYWKKKLPAIDRSWFC